MTFRHIEPTVPFPKLVQHNPPGGERYYEHPDGSRFMSVTSFIGKTSDKAFLEAWRKRVGDAEADRISNYSKERGTLMHTLFERYLKDEAIDYRKVDFITRGLFNKLRPHLDRINNIRGLETQLFSRRLGLAGTVDLIAEYDGELAVIDFKTSEKAKKEEWIKDYFLQETIYREMYLEMTGVKIKKIITFLAAENEILPMVVIKNPDDYLTEIDRRVMMLTGGK